MGNAHVTVTLNPGSVPCDIAYSRPDRGCGLMAHDWTETQKNQITIMASFVFEGRTANGMNKVEKRKSARQATGDWMRWWNGNLPGQGLNRWQHVNFKMTSPYNHKPLSVLATSSSSSMLLAAAVSLTQNIKHGNICVLLWLLNSTTIYSTVVIKSKPSNRYRKAACELKYDITKPTASPNACHILATLYAGSDSIGYRIPTKPRWKFIGNK